MIGKGQARWLAKYEIVGLIVFLAGLIGLTAVANGEDEPFLALRISGS